MESQYANVILLSGEGNLIRNNVIKARTRSNAGTTHACDQEVAILNYGAEATVEGNEIRYSKSLSNDNPTFAIYLRNAPRSIVSNNRIRFQGHRQATTGIGLQESPDTRVTNNSIKGSQQEVAQLSD